MGALLCLLSDAACADALADVIAITRAAGASVRVAAPADAVDAIQALGISVDHAIRPSTEAALGEVLRSAGAVGLVVAPGGALSPLAARQAAAAGVPLTVASKPEVPAYSLEDFVTAAKHHVEEIAPEEALRILQTPDREGFHFVDVREPDEFAEGHLPGARSSPRGFLVVRADLEHYKRDPWFEDRDRPMILYCGGGHRSALAVATLQRMGFTRLRSLAEGWTGWTERGHPIEK